jgi:alkylation response protein AidB-like acyl-CoA dehydrogenase
MGTPRPSTVAFRHQVQAWLGEHGDEIRDKRSAARTVESDLAHTRWLFGQLWDAGFTRWGWPEHLGGVGGPGMLRAVVIEEVAFTGLANIQWFSMPEVLAPTFAAMAEPELVREQLESYLSGAEWWCQGFSEPGAGSDLASLTTRAVKHDDRYIINGQKVWTSFAHLSERCVLLARTGEPDSGHRGISAFFVDMDSPGVEVRPLRTSVGDEDFCEVFFDDVDVSASRMIGKPGDGWTFAMRVLSCERATVFWGQVAALHESLTTLMREAPDADTADAAIGEVYQAIATVRARSWTTQHEVDAGKFDAAASSIDKVLMTTAHQRLYDTAVVLFADKIAFGDDPVHDRWRHGYLHSRAASIYGGTAEIQRNIIAERLLGLPR